jgi:hypothetical protein
MSRSRVFIALLVGGLPLLAPAVLQAQSTTPAEVAATLRLVPRHPMQLQPPGRSLTLLPDTVIRKRKDYTITGS